MSKTARAIAHATGRRTAAAGLFVYQWLLAQRTARISSKRLRVVETVSLGDKRFAALLSVDGAEFLIGGSGSSVAMLASLDRSAAAVPFAAALQQAAAEPAQC